MLNNITGQRKTFRELKFAGNHLIWQSFDLLLQVIAEYLQKIDPKSDGAKRDWVAIYDECASVLYQVTVLFTFINIMV